MCSINDMYHAIQSVFVTRDLSAYPMQEVFQITFERTSSPHYSMICSIQVITAKYVIHRNRFKPGA